jgi:sirohydrochlorin cobaltochelatase
MARTLPVKAMQGTGLLLFAHGARDAQWAGPFEQVARTVCAARPQLPVRLAFLEFMAPDIGTAAAELVGVGCTDVHVLPLFLGAGGHVRKDLPPLFERLRARHPGVTFTLHPAVGEAPKLIAAMAEIALALPAVR